MKPLRTNRGLLKYILLSIITLGIYSIVCLSHVSEEVNLVASKHDKRHTMHYCLIYFIFSWLTLGIVPLVWWHRICNRIGTDLEVRAIDYPFGSGTWWGWGFFGSLIVVGPFIFYHKLFKAMNQLNESYNKHGE